MKRERESGWLGLPFFRVSVTFEYPTEHRRFANRDSIREKLQRFQRTLTITRLMRKEIPIRTQLRLGKVSHRSQT